MYNHNFILDAFHKYMEKQNVTIKKENCSIDTFSDRILIHSKDRNRVYCETTTNDFNEKILRKLPHRDLIKLYKKHNINPESNNIFEANGITIEGP